ncbi:MAG: cell division protein FtsQ/DivIB [Gemmatimonadaceae bacterium]
MSRITEAIRSVPWKRVASICAVLVALLVSFWGPPLLARLSFFRVRRVVVEGARYVSPSDVLDRLGVDTMNSVWEDARVLERRVASHPQVRSVTIGRKLPGTLIVYVTENLPVALIPSAQGLRVVDAAAQTLPIDPTRLSVDLPVVARADTLVLRLLEDIRVRNPDLFQRISDVRRVTGGGGELRFGLAALTVRAGPDLSAARFASILPVELDLKRRGIRVGEAVPGDTARRRARVMEIDLRFRDQVIARLQ